MSLKSLFVPLVVAATAISFTQSTMATEKITQTAGRAQLETFAPAFAAYNDDILFGEVWNRPGLNPHDRSMITVTTLVSKGIIDSSLKHHLEFAKKNGVTKTEISELLTHVGFYAGWPNAWGAFRIAKDVWKDADAATDARSAFEQEMIFPIGKPNDAYAKYFIGKSYLKPLTDPKETLFMANVTFEPGCRNNWHIHHADMGGGQILLCTSGRGWYQEEGKEAIELHPGDVITIPREVKHWHGAAKDSWFSHIAVEVPGENTRNEWCEPVGDDAYGILP